MHRSHVGELCDRQGLVLIDSITDSAVVRAQQDVVSCPLGEGAALLDLNLRTYFSLNGVGSHVWNLLRDPRTVSDLHRELIAHYDVDPGVCHAHLVQLLGEFADAGLVRISDGADR